ncbi:MAG: CDP-diacylglycerol--glycerol-3-phosphate 3-phosphatidyltransferase [Opitutales bacterium]|nr:CDP-diacylglycerol--glycerol-3-phosphate 3-phosphatidyltransferase [Opitutales bacterium]MCH8541763.1 CDP-diacylglycerol--glycerol-3-phosphate 3-phosphatidyltransferase [Opitutales bacterium]
MKQHLPNLLTLSRIPLLFIIVALLFWEIKGLASAALVLFIIAGLTDWLDGALARKWGIVSDFGKYMDALTDKILITGLMIALVVRGEVSGVLLVPWWFLFFVLLVLCREFLISGMRMVAAKRGIVLGAEKAGKQKTVTQIVAVGILLLIPVLAVDFGIVEGGVLSLTQWAGWGFFVLATILTVSSGWKYFRKYGPQLASS